MQQYLKPRFDETVTSYVFPCNVFRRLQITEAAHQVARHVCTAW